MERRWGRVFIVDDATPFGVSEVKVRKFTEMMATPPTMLDSKELAGELRKLIPEKSKVVSVGYGGALTYALLSQEESDFPFIPLNAKREYIYQNGNKRPTIKIKVNAVGEPNIGETYKVANPEKMVLLDDVVASATTVQACRAYLRIPELYGVSTLVLSGDTRGQFRTVDGSTIMCVDNTYAAQVVNGTSGFPAILSLRFALVKTEADQNFLYLLKYFDENKRNALKDLLRNETEMGELKLLYRDPLEFIYRNGGETGKREAGRWMNYAREFKSE